MNQADLLKSLLLILPHPITVDESCSAGICQFSEDQNDTNIPKRNRPRSFGRGHLGVPINQECERAQRREVDQPTIDNLILSVGRAVGRSQDWRNLEGDSNLRCFVTNSVKNNSVCWQSGEKRNGWAERG